MLPDRLIILHFDSRFTLNLVLERQHRLSTISHHTTLLYQQQKFVVVSYVSLCRSMFNTYFTQTPATLSVCKLLTCPFILPARTSMYRTYMYTTMLDYIRSKVTAAGMRDWYVAMLCPYRRLSLYTRVYDYNNTTLLSRSVPVVGVIAYLHEISPHSTSGSWFIPSSFH